MIIAILIIFTTLFILFIIDLFKKNPSPIFNIYEKPNGRFWLKWIFLYIVLLVKKLNEDVKKILFKHNGLKKIVQLEKCQKLSYHEKAIDAVYFNGAGKNGDYLIVGTARRKNKLIDGFLYLKINFSNLGVLETPKLPCTSLYQTEEIEEFAAEGIKIIPITPMKKWQIIYQGKMKRHENPIDIFDIEINVEWTSDLPYFNFDTDMHPLAMSKSLAYEKWHKQFFKILQENHQTHYEQHGDLKGTANIDGKIYNININALRDHSFGLKREWRNFYRYALHFFAAENGDRFTVGNICAPVNFSRLTIGYVYSAEDKKNHPIKSCDLELYEHGENGDPPLDYAFKFVAGGKIYVVQVNVIDSPYFYISKDWESKVVEKLCTFEINGVKGWGAAEWQYRNIKGKKVIEKCGKL